MVINWQILQQFIAQHHLDNNPLVVGLSGGADSMALLQLFVELKQHTNQPFSAIHVNHGLSVNANEWQQQVTDICQKKHVNLTVCNIEIIPKTRTSLEQQAREGRYQAIAQQLDPNSVLFTGHHQSDQFETFLIRLMRGSGLTGLTSMKPLARYPIKTPKSDNLQIARPLLPIDKSALVHYLELKQVAWIEDESNQDSIFDRNYIRNQLLPLFHQRWPKANNSVSTSIALLQQESELLNEYIQQDYLACVSTGFLNETVLDIEKLKIYSKQKQAVIARRFIQMNSDDYPSRNILNELLTNVLSANNDAQPLLKVGSQWLRVHNEHLYLVNHSESQAVDDDVKRSAVQCIHLGENISLPEFSIYSTIQLNCESRDKSENRDESKGQWQLQWGNSADKLKPNRRSGSKKVKEILKQMGCPAWLRDKIPLIYFNDKLVSVADYAIDDEYKETLSISLQ